MDMKSLLLFSIFYTSPQSTVSLRMVALDSNSQTSVNTTRFDGIFWILLLVLYGLQWLPVVILTCVIISNPNYEEGPSFISRMVLIVGVVLGVVNYIPITTWALLVPSGELTCSAFSFL